MQSLEYVYAIYPFDEKGNLAGVYVGKTKNLRNRIRAHYSTSPVNDPQITLHDLMRNNGFTFQLLEITFNPRTSYLVEEHWIDFFSHEDIKVFNVVKGINGDLKKCTRQNGFSGEPVFNGGGVVWLPVFEKIDDPLPKQVVYKNLRYELKTKDVTLTELHKRTGIPISTLSEGMNGRTDGFRFDQAVKIKAALESDLSLEELFEKEGVAS